MNSTKIGATCVVGIGQAGNADYAAASVTELTNVAAAIAPTVTFTARQRAIRTCPPSRGNDDEREHDSDDHGGAEHGVYDQRQRGHDGERTGTCTLTAAWAADDKYKAATATQKTIAAKASSGLAWSTPAPITYGTLLSSVN